MLKYQKNDCMGLLIGSRAAGKVSVTDVVPLFHDRVMSNTLESALELVEMAYLKEGE